MTRIRCKCGKFFIDDLTYVAGVDDSLTSIYACPYCSRQWRRSKVSGIKWRVYPHLKKTIESYLKIK